jgi:hypothetical protein
MTTGGTLTFNDGEFVDVSVNGVALVAGTDYNTTTANTIGGLSALSANDQVEIVVYDTFSVFSGDVDSNLSVGGNLSVSGTSTLTGNVSLPDNTSLIFGAGTDLTINHDGSNSFITDSGTGALYIQGTNGVFIRSADGGENLASFTDDGSVALNHDNTTRIETTSSGVDITGGFTATDGCTITTADNDAQLILKSTDTDSDAAPFIDLQRDSGSPADNDFIGKIRFAADDDAGNVTEFAQIHGQILDASNGSEDGALQIRTTVGGSVGQPKLDFLATETVFNEGGNDVNFRVESDNNTHAIFVNAGNDRVNINSSANPSEACQFYVNDVALIGGTNATTSGIFPTSGLGVITTQGSYCAVFYDDNNMGTPRCTIFRNGNLEITGALSKGSGSFRIDHPLPAKSSTHDLVHSFIEGPQADLIYRGKVDLVAGSATVNIDTAAGMTDGTFVLLCGDVQCFTSNEDGFTAVKGSVSGNTLTITAEADTCTDTISWMVVGERKDQHMVDTTWTDDNGKVIVEPLKGSQEVSEEE